VKWGVIRRFEFEGEEVEKGKVFYEVEYKFDEEVNLATIAEIRRVWYPIYPYANYVMHKMSIVLDGGELCINVLRIRMSWDGTGADQIAKLCLDVSEFEEIPLLSPNELDRISTVSDVKEYLNEVLRFVKDYTTYMVEKLMPGDIAVQIHS
jgi:hypothetical protein